MREWVIGLSAWMIQDGNYSDFARGQRAEFALSLYAPGGLEASPAAPPAARHLDEDRYEIAAQVLAVADAGWAVDFGIRAYSSNGPPPASVGDMVRGVVQLGVDPFTYFESLAVIDTFPPLIYTWEIEAIRQQTAPLVEVAPRTLERDPARLGWTEIERTDAWSDDDGHGEYLLACALQPVEPARRSATAL